MRFVFAKVTYLGFYPLGSDVIYNAVRIMQKNWTKYKHFVIPIGKKETVTPFGGNVFYATEKDVTVFFVAIEYGYGKYHIFSINNKSQEKMLKKISHS